MGCRTVRIGDVATFRKESVKPLTGITYHCYSLPAFDNNKTPEMLDGADILSNKLVIKHGDILVNKLNMRFKRIWPVNGLQENSVCSTEFVPLQPMQTVDRNYLLYVLLNDGFTETLSGIRTGTSGSHQRVKPEWILDYQFELPDMLTQHRVGGFLAAIDSKIEANTKLNDYLADLLDAQFDNLIESESAGWEAVTLLDIANYKNGFAMQRFRPVGDDPGLPVLKIRELGRGYCGSDAERCRSNIDEAVAIHDGDLIFSWSGTLLLDFWAGGDAGLNQHLFKVTSETCPSWFYYMWIKRHIKRFILLAKDRATTMGHIKRSALRESEVLIPQSDRMEELTAQMQPIVDEIIGLKVQSRKLEELRDALLPKLMSGEIDVEGIK